MQRLSSTRKLIEAAGIQGTLAQVVLSALALASVGLAHFIGFLRHVADPFVPVIAQEMAPGFVATFFLYLAFCAITGRVIAMLLVLTVNSLAYLIVLVLRRGPVSRGRRIIRLLNAERGAITPFHVVFALMIFSYTYIDVSTVPSRYLLELLGALVLLFALTIRATFYVRTFSRTLSRGIATASPSRVRTLLGAIVLAFGSVLVVSYLAGSSRFHKLWVDNDVEYYSDQFSGYLNVLLISDRTVLAMQHNGLAQRQVLIRGAYSLAEVVPTPEGFPQFPRLNRKEP